MRRKRSQAWHYARHHLLRLWRKGSDSWLPFVVGMLFLGTVILYMATERAVGIVLRWLGNRTTPTTSQLTHSTTTATNDLFDLSFFTNLSLGWKIFILAVGVMLFLFIITGTIYIIQSKKIAPKPPGTPGGGSAPPTPKKDWEERYREMSDGIKQVRDYPYIYFLWVIVGWAGVMGVLWMLYPELPTWGWLYNNHFKLIWSTPVIILIGMWSYKNESAVIKGMGKITWAPLAYLWITAIASDVDFSGWRNQFQSVSTSTASGATNYHYKDKHGNPFVDIPVPASGHWSQPYVFRGNEHCDFDSNVPIEVMPNGDTSLIRPHAPAEDGPHYPTNVRISIVQFRSTTGKDGIVQLKLIYTPR